MGLVAAPVELHQREREFVELLDLYRSEQPTSVLEIGVAQGGTLYHWLTQARDDVSVDVVAVDTFAEHEDNRALFPLWTPPNVRLHVIEGRSGDASTIARVREISDSFAWVFIDADHRYDAAKGDWLAYGVSAHTVVFHDIYRDVCFHPEIEVGRLWDELCEEYEWMEIVDPDAPKAWGGFGVLWP